MREFNLIELLIIILGLHLYSLDRKSYSLSIYYVYSYIYMAFGVGWGPHIFDWSGLHLTCLRLCISVKIHFLESGIQD
jgi:hypothetical protein